MGLQGHQALAGHVQIGQRKQDMQLGRVLLQALVARLAVGKQVLDDVVRMLDFGPYLGLGLLQRLGHFLEAEVCDLVDLAAFVRYPEFQVLLQLALRLGLHDLFALGQSDVACIPKHHALLAVQYGMRVADVGLIGGCGVQAVHQAGVGVHASVGLHAEVVVVALLGAGHVRVTFMSLVLGGAGRCDDGGIHQRACAHEQALLLQLGVDLGKDRLGQFVVFKQPPKLQQCGGVRHRLQVYPDELTQSRRVVHRVFQSFVAQAQLLLGKVQPQHALQPHRLAPDSPCAGVLGLNERLQPAPGHHPLHLRQEPLPPRHPLLARPLQVREAALLDLFHSYASIHARFGPNCLAVP